MGKIARVSARRLAYDQMKAERKQYILIANNREKSLRNIQLINFLIYIFIFFHMVSFFMVVYYLVM